MAEEKKGIFQKVKDWWNRQDPIDKTWMQAVAIWTVDGIAIGSIFTSLVKNNQMKRVGTTAYLAGIHDGELRAYRHIATCQNRNRIPMHQMDRH